ncbi:MAG: phosphoglucomutase/phosphomannomutase family protein [Candidatus Dormibacteraeota bacterium]|nr:phosphoglucomutase/phosphomannomutase family protein [Candidatus Dormibacteraeota bacterium]
MAIKFGTDGWRGVVGDDFTYENVRVAAAGIARCLGSGTVVVGYDRRFASELFAEEVARVLAGQGLQAILFDRATPTQVACWTVVDRRAAGAVIVTASHNPYIFNGLKFRPETGSSAPPEVIARLEEAIAATAKGAAAVERAEPGDERIQRLDPRPSYFQQVGRMVDREAIRRSDLSLVHEAMHGSGSGYIAELVGGGRTGVTELHPERNPWFGGVNPEPIPTNLQRALDLMAAGGHDLAICTDGDADRVGVIDERGCFVNQLQVFALLIRYLVEVRGLRAPIVKSINMTFMADRLAARYGLAVHEVPIGFKSIAPRMMAVDALLGGEESGGFAFQGHIPERDGLLAGLFLADYVARSGRRLSQLMEELAELAGPSAYARHDHHLPRDNYPEERRRILGLLAERCPVEVAGVAVAGIRSDDGYKFTLSDGSWVLLRASGTEPLIRVYSEAATPDDVAARLAALEEIVGLEQRVPA